MKEAEDISVISYQLSIAKRVELTEDKFLDPLLRNTDRMQGILVYTLQKLKKH
ncbi:hypothetical protein Sta7437_0227 [Stanieria cyanosphaera PCC 7437]|uniref:Uncharacterized protein n=1 Tax=Stanieria cyanosphaera (strain ATCC 29371 / PCC 7437) TaxID=111780 RepID=K9XP34_STAC7|nr:hypothetical protein [Stanieria cyanosphaera]AFZ33844.1 hypothetical protein Sta7437_0227 [Stanieria cyanosphaera PCC 7437]